MYSRTGTVAVGILHGTASERLPQRDERSPRPAIALAQPHSPCATVPSSRHGA